MARSPSAPPLRVWVWIAATLALVVVAALLWRNSDAAATESTTSAPADVPAGAPAGAVEEAWSADGDVLPADVVEEGRVVVGSAHGVRGLDVATGEVAWRYTRSNARLCGLTVADGVAVAVFRTAGRCDEAVALEAGTGVRAWTRNLSLRGDAVIGSTTSIVLAGSPTGVVTFDPRGNNIRWRAAPAEGCSWLGAVAGNAGVAVLERCADADDVRLRLYDGFEGTEVWTADVPADADLSLLGADELVGVRAGGEVRLFAPEDGALRATLPAEPAEATGQTSAAGLSLVRTGSILSAIDPATGGTRWSVPADGLPAAAPAETGEVVVPTTEGFVRIDALSGIELGRLPAPGVPSDGVATVLGPVVVLRLDDEVRGYR
jgi:outer membrane protein assembly factor BamB